MKSNDLGEWVRFEDAEAALAVADRTIGQWIDRAQAAIECAQTWEAAVKTAVEAEREACAVLANETVCDVHIPTGIQIYGQVAARAIRARGKEPEQ